MATGGAAASARATLAGETAAIDEGPEDSSAEIGLKVSRVMPTDDERTVLHISWSAIESYHGKFENSTYFEEAGDTSMTFISG